MYGKTLIYQEFPQGRPASRRPVVVIPALLGDQPEGVDEESLARVASPIGLVGEV